MTDKRGSIEIIDKMILITTKLKCEGRSHIMEHGSGSNRGKKCLLTQKAVYVILRGKSWD